MLEKLRPAAAEGAGDAEAVPPPRDLAGRPPAIRLPSGRIDGAASGLIVVRSLGPGRPPRAAERPFDVQLRVLFAAFAGSAPER